MEYGELLAIALDDAPELVRVTDVTLSWLFIHSLQLLGCRLNLIADNVFYSVGCVVLRSRVSDHFLNQEAYFFKLCVPFNQMIFSVATVLASLLLLRLLVEIALTF